MPRGRSGGRSGGGGGGMFGGRSSSPSSGGGGIFGRSSAPSRPHSSTSRPAPSNVPSTRPTSAVAAPPPAQPKQPGMFAQMASTAAGVAVGSTVGHVASAAILGGMSGGGSSDQVQNAPAQQQQPMQETRNSQNPCEYEMKQFLDCAQNQTDFTLCAGFNDALKQCKLYYNTTAAQQPTFM